MTPKWVVFKLGEKELCTISVDGVFPGEIKSTKELLAYENKVSPDKIQIEATQ